MKAAGIAIGLLSLIFCELSSTCLAQAQPLDSCAPKISVLQWQLMGMTEEECRRAGLYKLNTLEQVELSRLARRARELLFHCGPDPIGWSLLVSDPRKKIALHLGLNESVPDVIKSEIRRRIRTMPDIELVEEQPAADLSIEVILVPISPSLILPGQSDAALGYTVFLVPSEPCSSQWGPITEKGPLFDTRLLSLKIH